MKLTAEDILNVVDAYVAGQSQAEIALRFKTSQAGIGNILRGDTRSDVPRLVFATGRGGYRSNSAKHTTHGHAVVLSPEYRVWRSMKSRCSNSRNDSYADYGGRGISVCERWVVSFEAFLQDMGSRPSLKHSIDRIDNEGNYEPGNCRWATKREQANNCRSNRTIYIDGERLTVAQWARKMGVRPCVITNRLRRGWDEKQAVLTPRRFARVA